MNLFAHKDFNPFYGSKEGQKYYKGIYSKTASNNGKRRQKADS